MAKISEVDITSLLFQEGAAPAAPASTKWRAYFKSDGLYIIDDAGVETGPIGAGAPSFSGAFVYRTANQTIASATATAVAFNNEDFDEGSYHDNVTNNTRLTVPAAGKYLVGYTVRWTGSANDTQRAAHVRVNGSGTAQYAGQTITSNAGDPGPVALTLTGSTLLDLASGDYVELFVRQDSGSPLDVDGASLTSAPGTGVNLWIRKAG